MLPAAEQEAGTNRWFVPKNGIGRSSVNKMPPAAAEQEAGTNRWFVPKNGIAVLL